jgi:uncharacterized protein involved in outer membrane biogenesis/tetratricopeptide (TPR) repeat protein
MNNALLYLGGILITVLAVLFAVPRFVDWNSYRGVFEEEATRILGREVRVGGGVNVRLLPAPYVSFERLRIADVGDDGGNSIIRVESFTMWLSVPPLLRGVLEAHRVELKRPVVSLTANAAGSGNWQSLAIAPGSLTFMPKEVALQSVKISDGALIVQGPSRSELARFDDINGELNAEALEGPYKFKGLVSWGGIPRHLRLATAKSDANGDIRFKAAVDVPASGNSYVLDGSARDLSTTPKLEGDLTAKLALGGNPDGAAPAPDLKDAPGLAPATDPQDGSSKLSDKPPAAGAVPALDTPQPETKAATAAPGTARGFELKAKVTGTTLGMDLSDIAVSLEAGTTPQLITGNAKVGWADKMRLDVTLASRWLDLDQLAHTSASGMPLEAGRRYFEALAAALPAEADTNALLEFDQLTLGGEPISNVRLAAARSGGPLELKGVRADLPGGVRLDLEGELTPTANLPNLDGELFLSGRSVMRFLAWGLGKPDIGEGRNDGAFSIDGRFALGDGTLALTDASVEFAGTPMRGDIKLGLGDRKTLTVAIQGPRVDVAQFGPGLVGLGVLRSMLFGSDNPDDATAKDEANAASALLDAANADLSLDLKIASLVDGARLLNDVDAEVRLERGKLSIPRLRFSTPEGLYVDAEGQATDVPDHPKGAIRGLVSAPSAAAARALVSLLDVEDASSKALDRIARLAPFRLAGTLQLGGAPLNATVLSADGTLGGGRITATVKLDGGRAKWRTSPLDASVSLDSPDVAELVAALFDSDIQGLDAGAAPGRMVIKAVGTPSEGLVSLADVTGNGFTLNYRGQVQLPSPEDTRLEGDMTVAAQDARLMLALVGLAAPGGAAGSPIEGAIHLQRAGNKYTLSSGMLTLGDSIVSGDVALATKEDGRQSVDATLKVNRASFASLLAPIMAKADAESAEEVAPAQPAGRRQAAVEPPPPEATPVWPEQSFDLALLDRVDGRVDISFGSLAVEPGLALANAWLVAELAPEAIKVVHLDGDMLGGRLTSNFKLDRASAGADLAGALRIDIWNKRPPADDASPPPGDAVAFGATFTGRGLSPLTLISGLSGKGELTVGDATLQGNSPAAVSVVAQAALTGQGPSGGNALSEAIAAALKEGQVKLGKLSVPVEISDGALKLDKVRIEMTEGRSSFATAVELQTMRMDSEWQIEPKLDAKLAASASARLLPPVTVVYTGKLNALANMVPHVAAGALERELVVRKMELDVGELERLRKLDEERARRDAERRKAEEAEQARLEAERAKALEADQQNNSSQELTACTPTGNPDAALAACERLLASPLPEQEQAAVLYALGRAQREKGEVDKAINSYTRSIGLMPFAEAYNHRGIAYFDKGEFERATADYGEALRIDPRHAEALNNRAWTRYKAGNLNAALDDANRAISIDGGKAYMWDTRGHINESLGDQSAAISDYRRALELDASSDSSAEGLRRLGAATNQADPVAPTFAPSQASQRPRRKRPVEENWRPFQSP